MKKRTLAVIAGLSLGALACKDSTSVTDLNNVSAESLAGALSPASLQLLVTGMLNSMRTDQETRYIVFTETMGRDFYRLDNAEARWVTELIGVPADYSAFTGGGIFGQFYVTIRAAHNIINALPSATGLTPAQVAGARGLANTVKALSLYRALESRDSLGIATDVNHPIDDPPAPFVCKKNALAYISALLDSAQTDLNAAGSSFSFIMPAGYSSNGAYNTPAGILAFNRGIKGKVELYRGLDHQNPVAGAFTTSITALNAALGSSTSTTNGVYNTYSTAANEFTNPVADANIYLNTAVGDSIQAGDARSSKITSVASKTLNGITAKYKSPLTDPTNLTGPIAVLRNAELFLLRAQAKIENGDLTGATADINTVRVAEGALAPIAVPATKAAAISAVLYEKRYSLLATGAQRLVDLRAYSRLNATFLKKELATDVFQTTLPIPKTQLDTRNTTSITPTCS